MDGAETFCEKLEERQRGGLDCLVVPFCSLGPTFCSYGDLVWCHNSFFPMEASLGLTGTCADVIAQGPFLRQEVLAAPSNQQGNLKYAIAGF